MIIRLLTNAVDISTHMLGLFIRRFYNKSSNESHGTQAMWPHSDHYV